MTGEIRVGDLDLSAFLDELPLGKRIKWEGIVMSANLQPEAGDLEQLDLTEVQAAVKIYQNLFYHRTVIMEGIRKIAFRNMNHLMEAFEHCESAYTLRGADLVHCVQKKMLDDQRLEDNQFSRTLIQWATFCPLWVYLTLLYAEIEYFQKSCSNSDILSDDVLSTNLDSKVDWVSSLKGFRDIFLHPSEKQLQSELNFLTCQESYNLAPDFQKNFDDYLARMGLKIRNNLRSFLEVLPETQRFYCMGVFTEINYERMELYRDLQGMEHVVNQFQELLKQMNKSRDDITSWSPNPKQIQSARILAECMNAVSPSGPEQQYIIDGSAKQTPMSVSSLLPLIQGQAPQSYGNSRQAIQIIKNIGLYRRMIITVGVLLNEATLGQHVEQLQGRYTLKQLHESFKTIALKGYDEFDIKAIFECGLQHANELVSLGRVSVAILYEPLRVYAKTIEVTPLISNRKLDEWVAPDRLKNLANYRNTVFHVINHPDKADLMKVEPSFNTYKLYDGLSEFYGIGLIND